MADSVVRELIRNSRSRSTKLAMADSDVQKLIRNARKKYDRFFMARMDPELYRAAQSGNWDNIQKFAGQLCSQRTAGGNTVLHVVAQFCNSPDVVKEILERKPGLLLEKNEESETALHLAARKGHSDVVQALIDCAPCAKGAPYWWASGNETLGVLLRVQNRYGNTALHEAVRNNCYEAAKLLVGGDGVNSEGETPLYLAVENENYDIATLILSSSKSPYFGGPGHKTVLHAAALCKFPDCKEVIELILEKLPKVTKGVDKDGWTALHYAAKFNHQEVVRLLMSKDKTMAYVSADEDGSKTALHVAVINGYLGVAREILRYCPDCWEMITDERQNILHLAVKNERKEVLEFIWENSWAADLINQKDSHGNTPLHLYVATNTLPGHNLANHPGVNRNAFNNAGLTPLQLITESDEVMDRQKVIKGELETTGATPRVRNIVSANREPKPGKDEAENWARISEPYMIVATLIVTVTFAAGFTIPGGYDGGDGPNKGMAVLAKKTAFTVFVVSDSLALMLSIFVVFYQLMLHHSPEHWHNSSLQASRILIGYAMTAMVIAFVTGLYAVIPTSGLKIYLCVVAAILCCPIPLSIKEILEEHGGNSMEKVVETVTNTICHEKATVLESL